MADISLVKKILLAINLVTDGGYLALAVKQHAPNAINLAWDAPRHCHPVRIFRLTLTSVFNISFPGGFHPN
jgi:hypothetical protein